MRIKIYCSDKGQHPRRLIGNFVDDRKPTGPRDEFVRQAADNLRRADPELDEATSQAIALGFYDSRTRVNIDSGQKIRSTKKGGRYEVAGDGVSVEETRAGRYFSVRCKTCKRNPRWSEAKVTELVDTLRSHGRSDFDLAPNPL